MPDKELSGQKGTIILLPKPVDFSYPCSAPLLPKSKMYVHVPFRLVHSDRSNCGRGYSGRGISAAFTVKNIAAKTTTNDNLKVLILIVY